MQLYTENGKKKITVLLLTFGVDS